MRKLLPILLFAACAHEGAVRAASAVPELSRPDAAVLRVELPLRVDSRRDERLEVRYVEYSVELAGRTVGVGLAATAVKDVPASSSVALSLPVDVVTEALPVGVPEALDGSEVAVRVRGTVVLHDESGDEVRAPFTLSTIATSPPPAPAGSPAPGSAVARPSSRF